MYYVYYAKLAKKKKRINKKMCTTIYPTTLYNLLHK